MYLCFRVPPYGAQRIRAVRKEQKLYMWDWSQVPGAGERFENLVASQLFKYCHLLEDTEGHRMELRFIRDTDRREVDFVVLQNTKPLFAVECKTGERTVNPAIKVLHISDTMKALRLLAWWGMLYPTDSPSGKEAQRDGVYRI
jgi:hypothetical protein